MKQPLGIYFTFLQKVKVYTKVKYVTPSCCNWLLCLYYKVNARNGRKVDAKASVENARKVARLQSKGHAPAWNLGTLPKKWYFVPKIVLIYCEKKNGQFIELKKCQWKMQERLRIFSQKGMLLLAIWVHCPKKTRAA